MRKDSYHVGIFIRRRIGPFGDRNSESVKSAGFINILWQHVRLNDLAVGGEERRGEERLGFQFESSHSNKILMYLRESLFGFMFQEFRPIR